MRRPSGLLALCLTLSLGGVVQAAATKPTAPAASAAVGKSKAGPKPTAPKPPAKKPTATKKPAAKKPARKPPRWPTVVLYHVNRRETLRLRIADDKGRPVKGVQKRIDRFLRCHYTNKQHAMNPRLTRLIYETGRHFPGQRIEVVSGYRHPTVAKNPRSPHMKGLACDMRVQGVKNSELRDYLRRTFKQVGVGYYPNSSFVHLDVRKGASAFWIDYSGPKEGAMYAENPGEDLRTGKSETFRPAKIDPSWVDEETPPGAPREGRPAPEVNAGGSGSGGAARTVP